MKPKPIPYDNRHGGPWDRGAADAYYGRPFSPHYYIGATYQSEKIELAEMSVQEIVAYSAGYDYCKDEMKDWGLD